jgi:hypothetical protein
MIYEVGDVARVSVAFTDITGAAADPTVVTLTVQAPDNTQATYTPTHDSTGAYHYDLPIALPGSYFYRFTGTGAVVAVQEGTLVVQPTLLTPQPPPNPPQFTFADLVALNSAIAGGVTRVRYQDRDVTYGSTRDLLAARAVVYQYLFPLTSTGGLARQIRMRTSRGL